MQTLFQIIFDASSAAARFLFAWSWQAFLLLVAVYLIIKLGRFRAAGVRYRVWCIALVAVALLPLCTIFIQSFSSAPSKGAALELLVDAPRLLDASPLVSATPQRPAPAPVFTRQKATDRLTFKAFWSALFLVWASGLGLAFWRLLRAYLQSRRARTNGPRISFTELGCQDLENPGALECRLSQTIISPVLVGLWRSTILLPADLLAWTTAEERRAILLHELVHAQRGDQWENFFQALLRAVFYFHPLVRYACKQLCIERELSCDEQVLQLGTAALSYVESILKVAEKSVAADVLHQPAFITKKMLERRIEMIMKDNRSLRSARRWTLLILPVALIAVMLWVLAPNRSASAQNPQEPTREEREMRQKLEQENEAREKEAREKRGFAIKEETPERERELQAHREAEIKQALQGAEVLARVSELQTIYGRRHNETDNLIVVSAEARMKVEDEIKLDNVVVKTPEFTFRAEHAVENQGITNMTGFPIEVEHNGQVYYSYTAIAVAQRGGMVFYVVNKRGTVFTEKNQRSLQVEFARLLKESRE